MQAANCSLSSGRNWLGRWRGNRSVTRWLTWCTAMERRTVKRKVTVLGKLVGDQLRSVRFARKHQGINNAVIKMSPGRESWLTIHSHWTRYSRSRQTSSPVLPHGKLDETYSSSLILAHSRNYAKRWRHPQTGSTWHCIAVRRGPNYGHG